MGSARGIFYFPDVSSTLNFQNERVLLGPGSKAQRAKLFAGHTFGTTWPIFNDLKAIWKPFSSRCTLGCSFLILTIEPRKSPSSYRLDMKMFHKHMKSDYQGKTGSPYYIFAYAYTYAYRLQLHLHIHMHMHIHIHIYIYIHKHIHIHIYIIYIYSLTTQIS